MEVSGIGGQDAGGKMDYLSDCWGGKKRGERKQTGTKRGRQSEHAG